MISVVSEVTLYWIFNLEAIISRKERSRQRDMVCSGL